MGFEKKVAKSWSPIEHRSIGLGILAGLLISLTYLSPSVFDSFPSANVNLRSSLSMNTSLSMHTVPASRVRNDSVTSSPNLGNGTYSIELKVEASHLKNSYTTSKTIVGLFQNQSNSTVQSGQEKRSDGNPVKAKPLCDTSNRRSNLCDMHGDIRIHGNSSSVLFVTPYTTPRNESWRIKPYSRKTDPTAMAGVRELTVRSTNKYEDPPTCTLNHDVPALVFSVSGYTGNFFHDFTDILVPLFLTSYQFEGEVVFLVANFRSWWIRKYHAIFSNLSKYKIIDLDNDDRIHCFQRATVGLDSHDDMRISAWRSPNGYSMVDFTKFLRNAYSLPRASPIVLTRDSTKRPRLLIVARSRTRKFTNLGDIVKLAEDLGFEVVVGEAEANVARFARVVNTCDVMMGVHGAGLTNLVFLPTRAVLIQIVPWGRLDWIARTFFDEPSKGMELNYLEYSISVQESTLSEMYDSDHVVLKDPFATVQKLGKSFATDLYMFKQNVKLNGTRFRPVLIKALELLHEK